MLSEQAATLHGRIQTGRRQASDWSAITQWQRSLSGLAFRSHSLYAWIRRYSQPDAQQQHDSSQQAEIRRLKAELRRVTDERDILKRPPRTLPSCQGKVRLHPGARVRTSHPQTVSDDECPPERLLRLAAPAFICPSLWKTNASWPDQAMLARKRGRLWLSQDPG